MSAAPTRAQQRARWSCPEARLLLPYSAPRETWLDERRRGIGGSDASTIAGVNRWTSPYELWVDKTGRSLGDKPETPAMRMGNLLEPILLRLFTEETGLATRRAGLMASKVRPWQRVSLDALSEDGGIVECKTTGWRLAREWDDDQVADHAEIQAQHALAVTGRLHAWVVVLIDGRDFRWRKVERDEALIDTITQLEHEFWHDHVLADVPPPPDAAALDVIKEQYRVVYSDTREADDPERLALLVERLASAKALGRVAKRDVEAAEAELRLMLGGADALTVDGEPILTGHANGTFAAKRFVETHPDVAEQYMTTAPVLDVERLKVEQPDLYAEHRARVLRPVKGK